jgi:hypothetical protein
MPCRRIAVDARSKRGVFRRASCRARRRGALFLHRRDLKDSPSQSQSTKGDSDYRASSSARGAGETVHNGSLRLIPTVRGGPLPWPARKAAVHLLSEPVAAMPTTFACIGTDETHSGQSFTSRIARPTSRSVVREGRGGPDPSRTCDPTRRQTARSTGRSLPPAGAKAANPPNTPRVSDSPFTRVDINARSTPSATSPTRTS